MAASANSTAITCGKAKDRPKTAPHWSDEPELFAAEGSLYAQRIAQAKAQRDVVMVADKPTHVVVLCRNQFYFFVRARERGCASPPVAATASNPTSRSQ